MALNKDRLGIAIAAAVQAQNVSPGTAITTSELEAMWIAIANEIIQEFKGHAQVMPGTFVDSLTEPVTGQGVIE